MLSKQLEELIKDRKTKLMLFWLSFLIYPIILAIVGYILTTNPSPREPVDTIVIYVLSAVALVSLFVSFKPSLFFSDNWIKKSLSCDIDPVILATDQEKGKKNDELYDKLINLSKDELKIFKIINESLVRYLFYWAVVETIAIYGFVLMMLTSNFKYYVLFGSISFIRMLTLKSNYDFLLTRIRLIKERY